MDAPGPAAKPPALRLEAGSKYHRLQNDLLEEA
jgi:hypothetical protein